MLLGARFALRNEDPLQHVIWLLQATSATMIRLIIPMFLVFAYLAECIYLGDPVETVQLTPPIIKPMSQMDQVACYRSVRSVMPRILVESERGNYSTTTYGSWCILEKIVAHNYGHAGSGWTLAPGSATYVVDGVIKEMYIQGLGKDEPVVIVGAGVVGTKIWLNSNRFSLQCICSTSEFK